LTMVSVGSTCRVCGDKAKIKATEKLPDGFAMEATHNDGTLHTWVKYYSLDSVGRRKTGKPNMIVCPKCGKKGRVNGFRPYQGRPDLIKYVVRHEKIGGHWGKGKKISKVRQCYLFSEQQRKEVLMKLRRYINDVDNHR